MGRHLKFVFKHTIVDEVSEFMKKTSLANTTLSRKIR